MIKYQNNSMQYLLPKTELWPVIIWLSAICLYLLCLVKPLLWVYSEMNASWQGLAISLIPIAFILIYVFNGTPTRRLSPIAVVLTGICAICAVWTFPLLQQLSASFTLLGLYGFASGLKHMTAQKWRHTLLIASLISLIIPFFLVPGTGAGFYLRLLTADTAAQVLALVGHASLGAHDVLIFDNGIAQVDLPCAGLKSLFTGSAFFLLASLILRRSVTFFWLIGYSFFIGLLLIANTIRVITLIWVSEILELRGIAETIHMPLGLIFFICVCLAGLLILRQIPSLPIREDLPIKDNDRLYIFPILLVGLLSILILFKSPHWTPTHASDYAIISPKNMQLTPIQLTETESRFFDARQKSKAKKWQFKAGELDGYMLVVRSGAANGLHAPEVCLLGNGMSVDEMSTQPLLNLTPSGHYRWLTVDDERRTAVYWMQSGDIVTDDFSKRLFNYAAKRQRDWVMVTLLFNERHNPALLKDKQRIEILMDHLRTHFRGQT